MFSLLILIDFLRLVTFESQRENDCVTKYIIKEFEDQTARDYAIGNGRLQKKLFLSLWGLSPPP